MSYGEEHARQAAEKLAEGRAVYLIKVEREPFSDGRYFTVVREWVDPDVVVHEVWVATACDKRTAHVIREALEEAE